MARWETPGDPEAEERKAAEGLRRRLGTEAGTILRAEGLRQTAEAASAPTLSMRYRLRIAALVLELADRIERGDLGGG